MIGAVVRAIAFHQYGQGSISSPAVICGLGLLVLYSAQRGFSLGTPVFPSHQKTTLDLSCCDSVWFEVSSIIIKATSAKSIETLSITDDPWWCPFDSSVTMMHCYYLSTIDLKLTLALKLTPNLIQYAGPHW